MFCLKCGKEIPPSAGSCPHCGAAMAAGAPAGGPSAPTPPKPPVYTMPEGAAAWSIPDGDAGGRRRAPLLFGGIAAAVLVVALIVWAVAGLFSSPKGQVEQAFAKTAAAYAAAGSGLDLPDLGELIQGRSYSQRLSYALNSVDPRLTGGEDLSYLKGLGLRIGADCDQKGRKLGGEAALVWNDQDLAAFQLLVDGERMLFASPEFTKGTAYGLNTKTLGKDLIRLGAWDDEIDLEKIGFDLFELMELAIPGGERTKQAQAAMAEAYRQLFDAVQVDEGGRQSVEVNGARLDAGFYRVVVPQQAMMDCVAAWEDAMALADTQGTYREILLAMGFDPADAGELLSGVDTGGLYGQMADTMEQAIRALGDLELDVYVSGGYVSAVEWSERTGGSGVKVGLYLGGGENYVDDLSLEIAANGQKLTVQSTGDHAAKSGTFTDETVLRMGPQRVTFQLRYEPKADRDNFQWGFRVGNTAAVSLEGQLTATKDSIELKLDDLSVKAAGVKLISFQAAYYLGPCRGVELSFPDARMLADMDEEDLMDLAYDIQANAEDWAYDVLDKLPQEVLDQIEW